MTHAAILDVDGTLVDSNYQHAIAWYRGFRDNDVTPPLWRVHRHIGMGGEQLVASIAGDEIEDRCGDAIREAEKTHYQELIEEVRPFEGARDLLVELNERGHPVVLSSSASEEEVEHYIELLGAEGLIHDYTSSGDVERTKPEPDLIVAAVEKAATLSAVVFGDSTWDIEAARRAGLEVVAVLTGGFSETELREAGAVSVYESLPALRAALDETPLS